MAEESAVWEKEQELKLAQLQDGYHEVLDQARESPDDEAVRARKAELANEIVAVRSELRRKREADTTAHSDGEGVANPAPVDAQSGVNE
jgi:hypothetical protein